MPKVEAVGIATTGKRGNEARSRAIRKAMENAVLSAKQQGITNPAAVKGLMQVAAVTEAAQWRKVIHRMHGINYPRWTRNAKMDT